MLFTKLISLYFLLLNLQGFAASDPHAEEQQPAYRPVLHFRLPYHTFPAVLQATTSSQCIPLPRSVQTTLRTFNPTPQLYAPKQDSEVIFFKVTNCPGNNFSFVVKGLLKGENVELNKIARHLQDRGYPSSPLWPSFVRAEFTLELNGKHLTVYHAARGRRLYDILRAQSPSGDATQADLPLFRNLGRGLFNAHQSLRPTAEELALAVTDGQINIHRFYTDIDDEKLNANCVRLVPYNAEKMRYFFSRCFGDIQPTNVFLDGTKVDLIDYLTLTRDLPSANGFSSIANDVAYFIACTRVYFRSFYLERDARYLNTIMGGVLAGYLEKVPSEYRTDMFDLIRCGFNWFVDELMLPSLSFSPVTDQEKAYEAARRKYKNEEIEIILAIAAQLLFSYDASAAAA